MYFCNLALELSFGVALENLVGTVWAQQGPKWKSWGLHLAVYLSKLALKLMFRVVLKNLVEAVSDQHYPKLKSEGADRAMNFLQFGLGAIVWGCP